MGDAFEAPRRFYERHRGLVWTLVVLLPIAVVAVGVVVAPSTFYDRFVWQDLYGPLWADAHQCSTTVATACGEKAPNPGGVTAKEGYTVTSELVYGAILAASLYGIFNGLLKRYAVKMDGAWVAALLPYILLGPTARTLEDANVFIGEGGTPGVFAYLFISPIIYIHVAVYTVAFLAVGILVQRAAPVAPRRALTGTIAAIALVETLVYAFVGESYRSGFGAFAPWWVFAVAAAAGVAFFDWRVRQGRAGVNATLFALGLPLVAPALWLIGSWLAGNVWSEAAWNGALYVRAGEFMILFALVAVVLVGGIALLVARRATGAARDTALLYAGGLNLALVFGHMLDAFATWLALLDPLALGLPRYSEKHPFSDFLLQLGAGTPFHGLGFPLAKLLMVLGVIWVLDREFKEEAPGDREIVGLIKMAIFVLGFAPGLRDLLRVTMGV